MDVHSLWASIKDNQSFIVHIKLLVLRYSMKYFMMLSHSYSANTKATAGSTLPPSFLLVSSQRPQTTLCFYNDNSSFRLMVMCVGKICVIAVKQS
jgi:hypothetical protein